MDTVRPQLVPWYAKSEVQLHDFVWFLNNAHICELVAAKMAWSAGTCIYCTEVEWTPCTAPLSDLTATVPETAR
jgi:hypothetical protein